MHCTDWFHKILNQVCTEYCILKGNKCLSYEINYCVPLSLNYCIIFGHITVILALASIYILFKKWTKEKKLVQFVTIGKKQPIFIVYIYYGLRYFNSIK